jgi:hypothetical protein
VYQAETKNTVATRIIRDFEMAEKMKDNVTIAVYAPFEKHPCNFFLLQVGMPTIDD